MPASTRLPPQHCRWHACTTAAELERTALQSILAAAQRAIARRGAFHIVLAGGTTPQRIYASLRHAHTNWPAWHIYFGDERCLPPGHAERNSRMAAEAWLDHVGIPVAQLHPIHAELGARTAAQNYAQVLSRVEQFDLVLLGLGTDGHTASLFPGHDWGVTANASSVLAVHDAPKPPAERVSLSARRLSAANEVMFMVTGASKRRAVEDWRNGLALPAAAISPACGVDVFVETALLDEAAAGIPA